MRRRVAVRNLSIALFGLAFLAGCSLDRNAPPTSRPVSDAPERQIPSLARLEKLAHGVRFDLPNAELFVPDGFRPAADGVVPLFMHFQGGTTIAEENFVRMARPGVLIASKLSGRSGDFARPYADPRALTALLDAGEAALRAHCGIEALRFGGITITFFSAGYGAVREFLKQDGVFDRIDALIAADSIYADVIRPDVRVPPVKQMQDFMRFAQAAVRGEKTFVVAHSDIHTPYASTGECARLLLAAAGAKLEPVTGWTHRGVPISAAAHLGRFHVYAFDEDTPQIHVDILYMIDELARAHLQPSPESRPARGEMVTVTR